MINVFQYDPFSRKVDVYLFDGSWRKLKGKLKYEKGEKRFYVVFGREKVPAPEDINSYIFCDTVFIVRTKLSGYKILQPYSVEMEKLKDEKGNEIEMPVLTSIHTPINPQAIAMKGKELEPADIYGAILDAEMRKERMKTTLDKLLPIIMVIIGFVGILIFFVALWNSTGQALVDISKNLNEMSARYENITLTLREIMVGKIVVGR